MGYFSNGSEGESYQEHFCSHCIHDNFNKEIYCPIWNLHLIYNSDGANDKSHWLHDLIPRSADGGNGKCTMYLDRGLMSNLAIEKHEASVLHPSVHPTARS